MPQTPNQGFPYPADSDIPDIPADFEKLALAVEKRVVGVYTSTLDRDTSVPSPETGQVAVVTSDMSFWIHDGSTWRQMYISLTRPPQITSGTGNPSGGSNGDVYFKV